MRGYILHTVCPNPAHGVSEAWCCLRPIYKQSSECTWCTAAAASKRTLRNMTWIRRERLLNISGWHSSTFAKGHENANPSDQCVQSQSRSHAHAPIMRFIGTLLLRLLALLFILLHFFAILTPSLACVGISSPPGGRRNWPFQAAGWSSYSRLSLDPSGSRVHVGATEEVLFFWERDTGPLINFSSLVLTSFPYLLTDIPLWD